MDLLKINSVAKQLNNRIFTDYYYRLMLIARSVFEWKNLPEGMDEKWIEKYLFTQGKCVFFHDKKLGYMITGITEDSNLNHYDEPTTVRPFATNYIFEGDSLENNIDCVIIRNNDEMIPTSHTIQLYAYKLTTVDRSISVNIEAQKTPIIVKCSEKQKLTLKKVIQDRNDNEPVIWGDQDLDLDGISVLNTRAPEVFKDLELEKHMIWNECMTFLGINNANMDKKERLVDDEVQANNEQVEAAFNIMLKARKQAAKQINKIFGTNIQVEKRIKYNAVIDESKGSERPSEEGSEKITKLKGVV